MCMKTEQDIAAALEDRAFNEMTAKGKKLLLEEWQAKPIIKAHTICQSAIVTMVERGKTYDKDDTQEERSMGKTVAAFNALTGHTLTEEQGWLFMVTLKMARAQQGEYKDDNYLDGTAYFALAGEAANAERA